MDFGAMKRKIYVDNLSLVDAAVATFGGACLVIQRINDNDSQKMVRVSVSLSTEYYGIGDVAMDICSGEHQTVLDAKKEVAVEVLKRFMDRYDLYIADFSYVMMKSQRRLFDLVLRKLKLTDRYFGELIEECHAAYNLFNDFKSSVIAEIKMEEGDGPSGLRNMLKKIDAIGMGLCNHTKQAESMSADIHGFVYGNEELDQIKEKFVYPMEFDVVSSCSVLSEIFKEVMDKIGSGVPAVEMHGCSDSYYACVTIVENGETVAVKSDVFKSIDAAKADVYFKALKHVRAALNIEIQDIYCTDLIEMERYLKSFDQIMGHVFSQACVLKVEALLIFHTCRVMLQNISEYIPGTHRAGGVMDRIIPILESTMTGNKRVAMMCEYLEKSQVTLAVLAKKADGSQ